ncbi:MAG: GDP-L-fucose synthase [Pseudohongiella sp.]|nr:GDP-L-fucose synthase [Pseudohongiella sp.]
MQRKSRVFVAGHRGMVGSALVRKLEKSDGISLITATRSELDLTNQSKVDDFFRQNKIDQVYLSAAKVGGIHANNTYAANFIYDNLMIAANVIHAAHENNVQKLLYLGSSCIYPKVTDQPIPEKALLTGSLEPTNEPYAIAKIAGIKLCESYNRQYGRDYRSVMPSNLYGQNDNFHPENSHVIPALMRRFHEAKVLGASKVVIWGSGRPRREFLHVDDLADACVYLMGINESDYKVNAPQMLSHVNVGTGADISIKELAETLAEVTGFAGKLEYDSSKPDGTLNKLMDVSHIGGLGWSAKIPLTVGLASTYDWFVKSQTEFRR